MERCPLCRATLNGAETCRRCKAELRSVIRAEREGRRVAGAAMLHLSRGDAGTAAQLLRRALAVHAVPEIRALSRLVDAWQGRSGAGGTDDAGELDFRNL
jgi:hypothetical protein